MIKKGGYTYIMANKSHSVLYVGVTSDLNARVIEHRFGEGSTFTRKYNCHHLVYFEMHDSIETAIHREKRLKKWNRKWKEELVERLNPNWLDLYEEVSEMR